MALDAANFISELSITDPPGIDPLSQGDDQIRTIKRATQQSFPNIDKAVTLTADQMLLMAIKNESNIFTAGQFIQNSDLILNAAVDGNESVRYQLGGLEAWALRSAAVADNNDFALRRSDVLGSFVDEPWKVSFATGIVDFAQVPTVLGAPLWIAGEIRQFAISASPGANWFLADGTNGTVNLADRWLVGAGAFAGGVGSDLNAKLDSVTTATGNTGNTALTEAQMPSHRHRIRSGGASGITDVALLNVSNQTVVGANRGNTSSQMVDQNSGGQTFIENTGSGSNHNHADGGNAMVIGQPTFVGTVQPVSVAVERFQYVP